MLNQLKSVALMAYNICTTLITIRAAKWAEVAIFAYPKCLIRSSWHQEISDGTNSFRCNTAKTEAKKDKDEGTTDDITNTECLHLQQVSSYEQITNWTL